MTMGKDSHDNDEDQNRESAEKERLIGNNDDEPVTIRIPKRKFIVEPVLFMFMMSAIGTMPIFQQYLYARIGNHTILKAENASNTTTSTCLIDKNSSEYIENNRVQAETAIFTQNLSVLSTALSICVTLFMGGYSDRFGRRVTILTPSIGCAFKNVGVVLIMYLNAPIHYFYITSTIEGLSGGFGLLMMGAFSYIADITKPEERGLSIAIAEGVIAFAAAITQIGLGYWIQASSFLPPMMLMTFILVLNALYVIFFVPETVIRRKHSSTENVCSYLAKTAKVYLIQTDEKRRGKLLLSALIMVIICIPSLSGMSIRMLFQMNMPLCWNSVMIGFYTFEACICMQVGAIGGIWLLRKCFSELWIVIFGCLGAVASHFLNVVATTDLLMFLVPPVGLLSMVNIPMFRTVMSRLTDKYEQGALFAGIALIEQGSSLVGSVVGSQIYKFSLAVSPGFVFFIYGCFYILAIPLTLILIYMCRMKNNPKLLVNIADNEQISNNNYTDNSINGA